MNHQFCKVVKQVCTAVDVDTRFTLEFLRTMYRLCGRCQLHTGDCVFQLGWSRIVAGISWSSFSFSAIPLRSEAAAVTICRRTCRDSTHGVHTPAAFKSEIWKGRDRVSFKGCVRNTARFDAWTVIPSRGSSAAAPTQIAQ